MCIHLERRALSCVSCEQARVWVRVPPLDKVVLSSAEFNTFSGYEYAIRATKSRPSFGAGRNYWSHYTSPAQRGLSRRLTDTGERASMPIGYIKF